MLYDNIEFSDHAALKAVLLKMEEYPYHMHKDILEIIFTLEGTMELTVVNNVLQMQEGDIYICSPNELHRLQAVDGCGNLVLLLYLNLSVYKSEFPHISTYQFANSAIERNRTGVQILGSYLKKQIPLLLSPSRMTPTEIRKMGDKILRILIQEFQCYNLGKGYPEFNKMYRDNEVQLGRIRRICDYIYAHYDQPIKIEDVAATEHISPYHLTHIMKTGAGVSFRTFLNLARVEKSATLLLENEKSLQTVGYECGFSKYAYFTSSFEKSFRMTPQQYREKYKDRTILRQKGRWRLLSGAALDAYLDKLSGSREEVCLDLAQPQTYVPFRRPDCVNLWGFPYDHVTDFPLLKELRKELPFQVVGIDEAFLRQYRHHPQALPYLFADFQALHAGLRFFLTTQTKPQTLIDCLSILDGMRAHAALGPVEFYIFSAGQADEPQVRALKKMAAHHGYAAQILKAQQPLVKNLIYNSGYMPCFLLRAMAEHDLTYANRITLLDRDTSDTEWGCLSLVSEAGLKKPIYHLLSLLGNMEDQLVAAGNMYFVTCTPDGKGLQVLLYYCDKNFDPLLEDPDKAKAHISFLNLMAQDCDNNRSVSLRIDHITGRYALRKYRLSPEDYVSKYPNSPFLTCDSLSKETLRVLNNTLAPEESLTMLELKGNCQLELNLSPFEIVLLVFEPL